MNKTIHELFYAINVKTSMMAYEELGFGFIKCRLVTKNDIALPHHTFFYEIH